MPKEKDPAFLFYPEKFLTGITFLNNEQTGKYIKLLCYQHQFGGLVDKIQFNSVVGDDKLLISKFIETEDGFYNLRLMKEMEKRNRKCNNLSDNAKIRWAKEKEKQCKSNAIASGLHMPTKDTNKDTNKVKDVVKDLIPYKKIIDDLNKKSGQNYKNTTPKYRELIKTLFNQGYKIEDFFKVHNKMVEGWTGTQFEHCIRPLTLYSNKFDSYLNFVKPKEKESIFV